MSMREPKDLLNKFADSSEELIQRIAEIPGADRFLGAAQAMRERMDDMQKRVRGIDALEARIAELERRLDDLSGSSGSKAPARRTSASTSKRSSASRSKSATSKASASKSGSSKSSGTTKKSSSSVSKKS